MKDLYGLGGCSSLRIICVRFLFTIKYVMFTDKVKGIFEKVTEYNEKVKRTKYKMRKPRAHETILDDPKSELWNFINGFIVILIIISIFVMSFESIWLNWLIYEREIFIFDWVVSIIFAIEYFYRLAKSYDKIGFVLRPMSIIDLLAFLPFFIETFIAGWANAEFFIIMRLFRIFRILKIVRYLKVLNLFFRAIREYRHEYQTIFLLIMFVLTLNSVVMYSLEWATNPKFSSIPAAMWWAVVTMSTVWYWDVVPQTDIGRMIWSFAMLIWPLVIAFLSALSVVIFMDIVTIDHKKLTGWKICKICYNQNIDKDANYCKICWQDMK